MECCYPQKSRSVHCFVNMMTLNVETLQVKTIQCKTVLVAAARQCYTSASWYRPLDQLLCAAILIQQWHSPGSIGHWWPSGQARPAVAQLQNSNCSDAKAIFLQRLASYQCLCQLWVWMFNKQIVSFPFVSCLATAATCLYWCVLLVEPWYLPMHIQLFCLQPEGRPKLLT